MELGIGMFGDLQIDPTTGKIQAAQTRLQEIIEEIKLMDEVGIDFFGMGEHHRADYAVASPEIILAAAASVTKNIKLGSAVSVISSSDPVKLYQDFSTVDLISNGRAEIMAGRGSFIESFPLFGYDLKDYSSLFEEKLNLLLRINNNETVNWTGKHRASLINQSIYPRAMNQGKLPIWVAVGGTTESVIRAAKLGLPVMFAIIGGSPVNFKPLFEIYEQAWVDNGHDMKDYQVGVHMHSFFGEDAKQIADYYYPFYSEQMNRIGASRGWPPYQKSQYDYGRSNHGHLIVGDANQSIDKIIQVSETFGLTRFSAHMDVGSPDHKQMMKAIEIYGTHIVPKVKEALKK
ncbi:LLM class flavin-dependent oxidoreductase [Sphingobacterium hungaricum]|uniref:LLM class flavin-dependent oxidoreductase n=1 Tax=Sphingobacterium hungaricum TaxID=2082723 RepID=A0A928YPE5_9SPHI|nr:LLM class flavin-dependent oxidoreductase [Sphingobacterium hungaricum]MBE8713051.1 LLM class flavin-dependent oxidoreductase [Sphingobacterium hungaricum]